MGAYPAEMRDYREISQGKERARSIAIPGIDSEKRDINVL
jgi:hypothetical protein